MKYLCVFLFLIFSIHSDELAVAVTENDPSALVEGVSMITGDLYSFDEDYVVQGAEPIRLQRAFISRLGTFRGDGHLRASFSCLTNEIFVNERNGTTLCYFLDPSEQKYPQIGKGFYGEKEEMIMR